MNHKMKIDTTEKINVKCSCGFSKLYTGDYTFTENKQQHCNHIFKKDRNSTRGRKCLKCYIIIKD